MDTEIVLRQSQKVELVLGTPLPRQRALVFVDAWVQLANTVDDGGAALSSAAARRRLGIRTDFGPSHCRRQRRRRLSTALATWLAITEGFMRPSTAKYQQ